MPEYDAFGRKIGENTLEGLGGEPRVEPVEEPVAPPEEQQPAPTFTQPTQPAPTFTQPTQTIRVRRGLGCIGTIVGLSVLIGIAGVVAVGIVAVNVADDATTIEGPEVSRPEAPAAEAPAADVPRGLERGSLVRHAKFAQALNLVRGARLGRLRSIRVAPDRIDVQLLTPGGRLLSAQVTHEGELRRFSASGPGFGSVDTVPYSRVNTAAPERLTRAGARRLRRSTASVDYLAYVAGTGEIAWGAFFKGGGHVQGDRAGRFLRRVS